MNIGAAIRFLTARLWRLLITCYEPSPLFAAHLSRAQSQEEPRARATVAVLSAAESERLFGVAIAKRGIQPVFLRVENRSDSPLRLQAVSLDPNYFTPLEAAGVNHFSILRRLSAFGTMGWLFLPLLALVPLKLITACLANTRMDDFFRSRGFRLGPIDPGRAAEGFFFTTLDLGTKAVHVRLHSLPDLRRSIDRSSEPVPASPTPAAPVPSAAPPVAEPAGGLGTRTEVIDFLFTVPVPGIAADYLDRDFERIRPAGSVESCTLPQLLERLERLPPTTTDAGGTRRGDPVNLVLIGDFAAVLSGFAARWDESETISLGTCWKTVRAFLLGTNYRYSPVSSLHLFGRDQDIALQRTRHSINERLHLRLWLTTLSFAGHPVWVGQVSRDIGVRFTTRAWNLTTHRIDPDVDEARDYVIEDLVLAKRVAATGYVAGVGACPREAPRHNLTGDPYSTDGQRAVILLSPTRALDQG
jgi:hypothetical protein